MDRRDFIQRITVAGAGGAAAAKTEAAQQATHTVSFTVKGFSCITCAVGLEVMLRGQPGVTTVKATYPEGRVVVGFDAGRTSEEKVRAFIATTGFEIVQPKR